MEGAKIVFLIEEIINIILDFSKGKAEILGMCSKIVLGTNKREFVKLGNRLVKICD